MTKHYLYALLIAVVLVSCSKKDNDAVPLVADFTVTATGTAPNAQLTITNKSTGDITSNTWTFGEGASQATSTDKTPQSITVDKKGDLSVKLTVSNGTETKEVTKIVTINGNNAVTTYSGVEFALNAGSTVYGRYFSFETGKIYKDSEINATSGPKINLAFGSMGYTMYYFESPTYSDFKVTGASNTDVINAPKNITASDFASMTDDSKLAGLTIKKDGQAFGNSGIPGVVLFQLANGKKGIINTKSVNSDRILVDIKIQKY